MSDSIQRLVEDLLGSPEAAESGQDIGAWRKRIDLLDRLLLALLNERSKCANEIGHIKKELGMPVYVPSREDQVLANVQGANEGPLPDSAVRHLFERIIDETRSLERRYYQDESDGDEARSPSQ